jgi:hypothetical protein
MGFFLPLARFLAPASSEIESLFHQISQPPIFVISSFLLIIVYQQKGDVGLSFDKELCVGSKFY